MYEAEKLSLEQIEAFLKASQEIQDGTLRHSDQEHSTTVEYSHIAIAQRSKRVMAWLQQLE